MESDDFTFNFVIFRLIWNEQKQEKKKLEEF